jgi:Mg-chelatase subunit ChlD
MEWSSLHADRWWPLLLAIAGCVLVASVWLARKGSPFPDVGRTRRAGLTEGLVDRMPLIVGMLISLLLVLAMMGISVSRLVKVENRARDFLVIVDTSRSMRENTSLLRADYPPRYERRADLYAGRSDDPSRIPQLARYEIARESLLHYLATRREEDRVGLIYFNSMVYLLSGFTSNFAFIEQQLAGMDPYVTYGTNIRWALEQGLDMIERYPGRNRRAVILLTDAEARNTLDLQQQLDRLRRLDVAFYLLWITTDADNGGSALATEFLRSARKLGSVYTIDDVGEGYLDEALEEIADLEDYAYREVRHERVELSRYCLEAAEILILAWVLAIGTLYLPLRRVAYVGRQHGSD